MTILSVKYPYSITIIARGAPHVLLVIAGHGGCCKIFGIWKIRLLSKSFWKCICGIIGWVLTKDISLWPAVFIDMSLFATLVTSCIWPGRWPSYRATAIYTEADIEVNLIQILVNRLLNVNSLCLQKWRLVLRLLCAISQFPPLWIHKIVVFLCSLLYKGLICDELLLWYDIHVAHTEFLDKLCNLLVLLNITNTEYGVRSILKDSNDAP